MITFSGVQMSPGCGNCPTPEDIAVGMCRITRYAGALWVPLAAHSILVAELAFSMAHPSLLERELAFAMGLVHDAHETVTGEVTRHYKPPEMKVFERELDNTIFHSLNLPVEGYRAFASFFKQADEKALTLEATILGLKDWTTYYRRMEGKEPPALESHEAASARKILNAWSMPEMVHSDSRQVRMLTKALEFIQQGHRATARRALID